MTDVIKSLDEETTEEETSAMRFDELLNALYEVRELLITVPLDQVDELKEGLRSCKGRHNYAIRRKGGIPPTEMLEFADYPAKNDQGEVLNGQQTVHVKLKPRKAVEIYSIKVPDSSL